MAAGLWQTNRNNIADWPGSCIIQDNRLEEMMYERRLVDDRERIPDDSTIEEARAFALENLDINRDLPLEHIIMKLAYAPRKNWSATIKAASIHQKIEQLVIKQEEEIKKYSRIADFLAIISASAGAILLTFQYLDIFPRSDEIFRIVFDLSPLLVTPFGIFLAVTLFACRGYLPKFYGTLEIIVGVLTISSTVDALSIESIPSVLPFLGGIYVVIRGLDNVAKALEPESFLGRVFSRLFNSPGGRR